LVRMAVPGWRAAVACLRELRSLGRVVRVFCIWLLPWGRGRQPGHHRLCVLPRVFWSSRQRSRVLLDHPSGDIKGGGGPCWVGPPPSFCGVCVRRCPTLPRTRVRSTIGAGGLNCRVRYGSGCFPAAVTTVTHRLYGVVCCSFCARACLCTRALAPWPLLPFGSCWGVGVCFLGFV
jgi:hypothetical protein